VIPVTPVLPAPEPVKPLVVPLAPVVPSVPVAPANPAEPPVAAPKLPAIPTGGNGDPPARVVDRAKPGNIPWNEADKFAVPPPPGYSNTIAPTPGDSAMTSVTRSAAAAAVLGGMLLTPATAAPPVSKVSAAQTDAELKKKLEETNNKLTTIQDQLKTLTELLNGKKDERGFPLPSDPGVVAQLKDLSDRLKLVEKDVAAMKKTQTSLRPADPIPGATVDPRTGKGTVRVVNEYPVQISIVVNGTSYRVAPSKSLDIDVPIGEFTYQLLESAEAPKKSVIRNKEPVTLRIR